ncbi:lipoprotein signal peptidase [Tenacibaculum sp. Mcav3-52]|uniref:Lipoprotein signal peptidase n=2 Tax=Tenacibaculum TaxID=104267 RepID=A0ABM7CHQ1_9FLAO|nr:MULTISPECIES: lipoprotein signal peptidase [Tenacibaculum]GFD71478.1 lipoprotein signal peptidase [Tenacibaculum sp. KUL113]GFD81531.1 lipoprotein signal peptidase [Tenacibaculum sp. KUL118]GFD95073.1 lipoprotein signal peptidase [Alteromonas sp. KUL154]GFD99685.1 lipoprotein signal peptidase [Alteromonas sp. KUL156]AZJ33339.1 lipoprotein signal peptidase [Tenacibaculum mesophilum]
MSKKHIAILTVILAILIDQISKIYIKTHFQLGEEVVVFNDWFRIHFTENNGMAWGFEFGGKTGKLFLTLFRVVAVTGIVYWLWQTIKRKAHTAVIVAIALILAGAVGNIIDSVFYGVIFDSSYHNVATLFSDNPYGELFHGKVVDMLYFPIYEGENFTFFNAIFNGADSWITIGVALLFLFNKQAFPKEEETKQAS